jgi:uncharacterized protein YhbP (UPF0306 family)
MAGEALDHLAARFLHERYTMALATDGPEGLWVASVYFAGGLDGCYFFSSPRTRHGRNLAANPRVAAAINEDEHDWKAIRGIQLEGECQPATAPLDRLRGYRAYLGKFPFVRALLRGQGVDAQTAARLLRTQLYLLRPTRVFYLDNRAGFGQRQEVGVPSTSGVTRNP